MRGFKNGIRKYSVFFDNLKKEELLEKKFIKDKLAAGIEDLQDKVTKLQHDFSDFLSSSKFNQEVTSQEIKKSSNNEIDDLKKKVENLEDVYPKVTPSVPLPSPNRLLL